jgi:hypothetical protein
MDVRLYPGYSVFSLPNPKSKKILFSEFFLLRLLEDLLSIEYLSFSPQFLPPTHPYYNLLTKVESRPHLQVHAGPIF